MSNPFRPVAPANSSFLPEDYIARKTESRVNILILSLFMLVMAGVVGAFLVTNQQGKDIRARQMLVNEQFDAEGKKIEQLKALESQRAQMMEKAEITSALIDRVPRWAVLGEVTLRKPMSSTLDSLVIKSTRKDPVVAAPAAAAPAKKPIVKSLTDKVAGAPDPTPEKPKVTAPTFTYAMTISGSADNNSDVADFLKSLKDSPILDKVELTFIREAREKDKEFRKFEISASIRTDINSQVLADSLTSLKAARSAQLQKGSTTPDAKAGPTITDATPKQENNP
ncbi:MAG TPA: PilN domain-containing protein [Phycisphaerales bacterium]|nr:PilN domain-containing protein [Phycisphaerales bacterium]